MGALLSDGTAPRYQFGSPVGPCRSMPPPGAPQVIPMFLIALVIGLFFGTICYKRPLLIIEVVSAALAVVPIWIAGYALLFGDFRNAVVTALIVFLTLGVGFPDSWLGFWCAVWIHLG
jgi:hypothetical protein